MGSTSTTTQNNRPYEAAEPLIQQGLQQAEQMYNSGGFNISPYDGNMVAGFSGLQQQAQGLAPMVAGMGLQGTQAAQMAAMGAMDPNARSAAFDQVKQNTIADIMPAINGSFAGSGMTGSGLHRQNLAKGLSAGIAGVENDAWQQGQQRALSAASMVPTLNNSAYGGVDMLNQYGGMQQDQAQQELNAQILQDQQAKSGELNALRDYLALTTGAGSQFGVQSSTSRQSPGLASILGFGLQGAGLFSDRRLKTDIKRVGVTDAGLPIYTYRYKGSERVHMGVMADEIEAVAPEAIAEINGYKAVDYSYVS